MKKKILFVCTGNTCRSVMAQALFKKIESDLSFHLNYQVNSAGISAFEGDLPTEQTIQCMAEYGIDVSEHRARQINDEIVRHSSFIFTMTGQQQEYLEKRFPQAKGKIFLFRPFCHQDGMIKNKEVPDPYGKDFQFYESICHQLSDDIRKLILYLREVDSMEKIAIGSDHGGYFLKNEIVSYLKEAGYEYHDFGCDNESSVDYPDYALKVAKAVTSKEYQYGILICGTGIGMSIAANKIKGIRAALCHDTYSARMT
ncbi:MAG: RpiB/LacA/LacB family sugar-phosphate isomerase, partial [Candidatus Aminicenantes bacterium]|nr:RpiB/LacA/LacB family sugar-phosphate isomerase [Candidatus Aminicenantes bacterium]